MKLPRAATSREVSSLLILNPSGQMGGAEQLLVDLVASLREMAPEMKIHLITGGEGPLLTRAAGLGIEVRTVPFPPALARLGDAGADGLAGAQIGRLRLLLRLAGATPRILAYTRKLRRAIRRVGPELIHTNGFKMHLLGLWAKGSHRPLVWHIHDFVGLRPLMARLLRLQLRRVSAVVTNSRSVAEDFRRVCGDSRPIFPVYNGIDLERFHPDGERLDLDALAGLGPPIPGTVRVGLLATMGRWKGHRTFLEALAKVAQAEDLPPLRAYVIGGALYQTDGSQHRPEELEEEARRLGLAETVGFTGFVSAPEAAMRALDVVVHASTQPEPFGLVIAEAMACRRAVVASAAGGVVELIEPEVDALGHPPGDVDRLAEAIQRLVRDEALRRRLGEAARATAERRFDRRRLAQEILPAYGAALETPV